MRNSTISISNQVYDMLVRKAKDSGRSADALAEEVLRQHLSPAHPYVEVIHSRLGSRAVIKGTRIGVSTIVSYVRLGNNPETIVSDILPHLTLAQVYDALSYYYDHQEEIDQELAEDSETLWMERLREMVGSDEEFAKITGQHG
jgi:uncharacterized protein (DUF433 family)